VHRQLQVIADELVTARAHLHRLADSTSPDWWSRRADPDRWSAGECVAHLNLTALAFLPLMRQALEQTATIGGGAPARFIRDLTGWILWRTAGPPVRFRVRTTAPFMPTGSEPVSQLLATFDRLQAEQLECVAQAEGRPIGRVKITSPFDPRLRYNLYACLTILPRHQERHIWQAERVLERLRSGT
jgi:DinB superfamily